MENIFTIDTEDWFHANYEDGLFQSNQEDVSTVEQNVDELLELFNRYEVKATFFILGYIAEAHPDLVKRIFQEGHEIASHGYGHQLVYKQTRDEFRDDIRKSRRLLEDLIGQPVLGYRAPSWSITEKSLWAIDILEEEGYGYTSSIFPTKNHLFGIPDSPRFSYDCSIYTGGGYKLVNIPPSTYALFQGKMKIPFSGGAYFRLFPLFMIRKFAESVNEKEGEPVVFYLHPREIDPRQPRLKLKWKDALIHYWGIGRCEGKLERILQAYRFQTMTEYLNRSGMWQKS